MYIVCSVREKCFKLLEATVESETSALLLYQICLDESGIPEDHFGGLNNVFNMHFV